MLYDVMNKMKTIRGFQWCIFGAKILTSAPSVVFKVFAPFFLLGESKMSRNKKVFWAFVLAMVLGFVALVLSPGCTTRDITFFSQTGSISTNSTVRPLPRQMRTTDLWKDGTINRGSK